MKYHKMWISTLELFDSRSCWKIIVQFVIYCVLILFLISSYLVIQNLLKHTNEYVATLSPVTELSDSTNVLYIPEIHPILIVSEARSGSSFTLHLLGSLPPSLTHFEPLQDVGLNEMYLTLQSDNSTAAEDAVGDLFRCRFKSIFEHVKRTPEFVWNICKKLTEDHDVNYKTDNSICYNLTALEEACTLFPIQVVKVLRLSLDRAAKLLNRLNRLKIVYLVRDPRATLHSRHQLGWKDTPEVLCGKLVRDYHLAVKLQSEFINRFTILRYEDVALNPVVTARKLFKWLRLPWLPEVDPFIAEHSEIDAFGSFGVHRRRDSRISSWMESTTWNDVHHMQLVCDDILKWYGYSKIHKNNLYSFSLNNESSRFMIINDKGGYQDTNTTRTFTPTNSFYSNYLLL